MSRMYQIGKPFESLQDYVEYPYNKLYWHGKLISKAITDNWQFNRVDRGVKDGELLKAELINGYRLYELTAYVFYNFDTKADRVYTAKITGRSVTEAEKRMIKYWLYGDWISTGVEHEYISGDESGIVKMWAVECND